MFLNSGVTLSLFSNLPLTRDMLQKFVCSLFVIVVGFASAVPVAHGQNAVVRARRVGAQSGTDVEFQLLDLVNRQRLHANLAALTWNAEIADVARGYSERMAREDFFDHFDPQGRTAIDRASKVRGWSFIGENLFVSEDVRDLPAFAVRGWMGSVTHRTNMLDPQWTSTGIGVARASNGDIYITELFTRR